MSVRYISVNIEDDSDKDYLRRIYYNLRSNVNSMIRNLRLSIDSLDNLNNNFTNYYSIDGIAADSKVISTSKEQLKQRVNYLQNVVVPAIEREISKLY